MLGFTTVHSSDHASLHSKRPTVFSGMPTRDRDANTQVTAALAKRTGTKAPKRGGLLGDPELRAELERLKERKEAERRKEEP